MITLSPEAFVAEASLMLSRQGMKTVRKASERDFRSLFGVSPVVASLLFADIDKIVQFRAQAKHLLWALLFLKVYSTEAIHCAIAGADPKTFRKLSYVYTRALSSLGKVCRQEKCLCRFSEFD